VSFLENTMSILLETLLENSKKQFKSTKVTADIKLGIPSMALSKRPVIAAEYNLITAFEMTNVAKVVLSKFEINCNRWFSKY
jgi:hypothetical protein